MTTDELELISPAEAKLMYLDARYGLDDEFGSGPPKSVIQPALLKPQNMDGMAC
jgi:hypothetical protein